MKVGDVINGNHVAAQMSAEPVRGCGLIASNWCGYPTTKSICFSVLTLVWRGVKGEEI